MEVPRPPRYLIFLALFNLILGVNLLFGTARTTVTFDGSWRFDSAEEAKIFPIGKGGPLAFAYIEITFQAPGQLYLQVQELVKGIYQHTVRAELIAKSFMEYIPIESGLKHQIRISNVLNQTVVFDIQVRYHPAAQMWSYFGLIVGIPLLLVAYPITRLSNHLEEIQGLSFRTYSPIGKKAKVSEESMKATIPKKSKK